MCKPIRTKVSNTNPTSEIEHAAPVVEVDIRALTLGHDRLSEPPESFRDMLLAELNER